MIKIFKATLEKSLTDNSGNEFQMQSRQLAILITIQFVDKFIHVFEPKQNFSTCRYPFFM
jgi:hypothetical protein